MNGQPITVLAEAAALARQQGYVSDLPQRWPRQGIAAVQIVDRFGRERVAPVIVVDFYREAEPK
jgi:hypothetical protein